MGETRRGVLAGSRPQPNFRLTWIFNAIFSMYVPGSMDCLRGTTEISNRVDYIVDLFDWLVKGDSGEVCSVMRWVGKLVSDKWGGWL
ncbi:unnamed protein product [Dovyalis caffra]|uniref:Uncharacterized protein n=1 Tax=Dovyalis caffra TaxID=77055 RepID=A0AAV1STU0_9ROSI|nr:unnamed protein product [Dovyalis caffra]